MALSAWPLVKTGPVHFVTFAGLPEDIGGPVFHIVLTVPQHDLYAHTACHLPGLKTWIVMEPVEH